MSFSSIVTILVALATCFFGYRLLKFWVSVAGALVFGALGACLGGWLGGLLNGGAALATVLMWVLAILLAVLGGILAFKLYKVGVFLYCFVCGFSVGALVAMLLGAPDKWWLVSLILGLAAGVVGVLMTKHIVILSTSLSGGFSAGSAIGLLIAGGMPEGTSMTQAITDLISGGGNILADISALLQTQSTVTLIISLVLIAAGAAVQYAGSRGQ